MDLGSRVKKQASAQVQLVITIIHKRASCNNLIFILYMLIINILTLCTCRGNQTEFILKIIFGIYTHCQTRVTERYVSLYNLYKFALSDVYSLMYCTYTVLARVYDPSSCMWTCTKNLVGEGGGYDI